MSKPTRLSMSYNDNIRFSYTVDTFNQCLHVRLASGVPEDFRRDAIGEAYEHYNATHKENEFIHPSAVVEAEDVMLEGTFPPGIPNVDKALGEFWSNEYLKEINKSK